MLHPHALRPTIPGCVVHSAILELRVVLPSGGTSTLKRDGLIVKLAFSQDHDFVENTSFDDFVTILGGAEDPAAKAFQPVDFQGWNQLRNSFGGIRKRGRIYLPDKGSFGVNLVLKH